MYAPRFAACRFSQSVSLTWPVDVRVQVCRPLFQPVRLPHLASRCTRPGSPPVVSASPSPSPGQSMYAPRFAACRFSQSVSLTWPVDVRVQVCRPLFQPVRLPHLASRCTRPGSPPVVSASPSPSPGQSMYAPRFAACRFSQSVSLTWPVDVRAQVRRPSFQPVRLPHLASRCTCPGSPPVVSASPSPSPGQSMYAPRFAACRFSQSISLTWPVDVRAQVRRLSFQPVRLPHLASRCTRPGSPPVVSASPSPSPGQSMYAPRFAACRFSQSVSLTWPVDVRAQVRRLSFQPVRLPHLASRCTRPGSPPVVSASPSPSPGQSMYVPRFAACRFSQSVSLTWPVDVRAQVRRLSFQPVRLPHLASRCTRLGSPPVVSASPSPSPGQSMYAPRFAACRFSQSVSLTWPVDVRVQVCRPLFQPVRLPHLASRCTRPGSPPVVSASPSPSPGQSMYAPRFAACRFSQSVSLTWPVDVRAQVRRPSFQPVRLPHLASRCTRLGSPPVVSASPSPSPGQSMYAPRFAARRFSQSVSLTWPVDVRA